MNVENSPYRIANLVYADNIGSTGDIGSGNRIELTATIRDSQNALPTIPQTVYWNCPRAAVQFSDKAGTIISTSETDLQTGEATIYVNSVRPAIAMITASLNQNGVNPYDVQIVFVSPQPDPIPSSNSKQVQAPDGSTEIQSPASYIDDDNNYAYVFKLNPNNHLDDTGLVAGLSAQIDPDSNIVQAKTLLFPVSGLNNPRTWSDLQGNGLNVPYQIMKPTNDAANAVQYLYQENPASDAYLSPWTSFSLTGAPWVQPDPERITNTSYLPPILWDPDTGMEVTQSEVITNDYFWWDTAEKAYGLIFQIHTGPLAPGDKIYPYIYANGFTINTDQRISYYTCFGEYVVTDSDITNKVITVTIPADPLVNIAAGADNQYGQIDVIYFVNQKEWSPKFMAPTQFDPGDLDPPSQKAPSMVE
ncbi:hypothetical protein DUT91_03555 [Phyllobacterium salinisoli]|uniref:Uncharacterized protein n=1 Tax=Phyllobacterium salinisoli TaxID=1899321 RepID=A0A368K922_9HYPH|nr:hypothetical protein [Phyllobacterium salinisoli]RCS25847.1 hypothetical protein DUT91_03555 [Phyllobacterium salinisoli]